MKSGNSDSNCSGQPNRQDQTKPEQRLDDAERGHDQRQHRERRQRLFASEAPPVMREHYAAPQGPVACHGMLSG
ncbi:MAG: hypothetical protein ABR509_07060 [Candidatus Limnocylindria bacterium]